MKRYYLAVLILLSPALLLAQQEDQKEGRDNFYTSKLRHIKGSEGVGIKYSYTKVGDLVNVDYIRFLNEHVLVNPSFSFEKGRVGHTDFYDYILTLNMGYSFWNLGDILFMSGYGGVEGAIKHNVNDEMGYDKAYLDYGFKIGTQIEFYLLSDLVLFGDFSQQYHVKDKFGQFRWNGGGGIRIYF